MLLINSSAVCIATQEKLQSMISLIRNFRLEFLICWENVLIRNIDNKSTINPIIKNSNRNINRDRNESYCTPNILNKPINPNTNAPNINKIAIITIKVIEITVNALVKKLDILWEGPVFFDFKVNIHIPCCKFFFSVFILANCGYKPVFLRRPQFQLQIR